MYHKYVSGAKALLDLPTVIVDVQIGSDGNYEYLTEYTCYDIVGGVHVEELRFSSRHEEIASGVLAKMQEVAIAQGISKETVESVTIINHAKCKNEF